MTTPSPAALTAEQRAESLWQFLFQRDPNKVETEAALIVINAAERAAWERAIEAAAKVAEERQRRNYERCPETCRCADGFHVAAAIRKLKEGP